MGCGRLEWMRTAHVAVLCLMVFVGIVFMGIWNTGLIRAQSECDLDCLSKKIDALNKRVTALELSVIRPTAKATPTKAAVPRETYVAISGGSVTAGDWEKLTGSEFWLDLSLYGNVAEITWQGWIENGAGLARLYDATNSRAVDGSEISVVSSSTRASFYSKPLSIWRGQNQYYIQLKSLTSQKVTISTPRLKIVIMN